MPSPCNRCIGMHWHCIFATNVLSSSREKRLDETDSRWATDVSKYDCQTKVDTFRSSWAHALRSLYANVCAHRMPLFWWTVSSSSLSKICSCQFLLVFVFSYASYGIAVVIVLASGRKIWHACLWTPVFPVFVLSFSLRSNLPSHLDPVSAPLAHGQSFFFPWHRWFVLKFEDELRKITPCITIPVCMLTWSFVVNLDIQITGKSKLNDSVLRVHSILISKPPLLAKSKPYITFSASMSN